jgi:hypothetical protein
MLSIRSIPKRLVLNKPRSIFLYKDISKVFPYTMQKYAALCQINEAVNSINKEKIPGSIVEMGCWNGGAGVYAAYCNKGSTIKRNTWLFDSFEGLPEFSKEDSREAEMYFGTKVKSTNNSKLSSSGFLVAEQEKVKEISIKMGVDNDVKIQKGWFQESLPKVKTQIGQIALLRLDGDLYESTKYCLEELYDLVAPNGYIIIDDFSSWLGCRKALYEFFYKRGISPYIKEYPYGGRLFFRK